MDGATERTPILGKRARRHAKDTKVVEALAVRNRPHATWGQRLALPPFPRGPTENRRASSPTVLLRFLSAVGRNELRLHRFGQLIRREQTLGEEEIVELFQFELVAQLNLGMRA